MNLLPSVGVINCFDDACFACIALALMTELTRKARKG